MGLKVFLLEGKRFVIGRLRRQDGLSVGAARDQCPIRGRISFQAFSMTPSGLAKRRGTGRKSSTYDTSPCFCLPEIPIVKPAHEYHHPVDFSLIVMIASSPGFDFIARGSYISEVLTVPATPLVVFISLSKRRKQKAKEQPICACAENPGNER